MGIQSAVKRVIPSICEKMDEISEFINDIPERENGIEIISEVRKKFYLESMMFRLQHVLIPALEHSQTYGKGNKMIQNIEQKF